MFIIYLLVLNKELEKMGQNLGNQEKQKNHPILISYGAISEIFEFLGRLDSIRMQLVNKYCYNVAVGRA